MRYDHRDVSGNTDVRVGATRSIVPHGALLHTTEGTNSLQWLQRGSAEAGNPASSDFLIGRTGTRWELSATNRFAYHAGLSSWNFRGRTYTNVLVSQLLIGIEIENKYPQHCTDKQLDSLAELLIMLAQRWQWRWPLYYIGHYEVALPMGRRSDPTGFLWGDFAGKLLTEARRVNLPGL